MTPRFLLLTAAALTAVCFAAGPAQAASTQEIIEGITTYTFGQSHEALTAVEDLVRSVQDDPARSKALSASLAALLDSDATPDCKRFVCRQLAGIGGPEIVPAVAPLLLHADTVDMARYALQPIPGPEVDEALLKALKKAEAPARPGIVNSIGERRASDAVRALSRLVGDRDKVLAEAAVAALGKIGGERAAKALAAANHHAGGVAAPDLKRAVAEARLLCADRFLAEHDVKNAASIYKALSGPDQEETIRAAAVRGLANANLP